MSQPHPYTDKPLTRSEVEALEQPTLLDFGTNWCSHCRAAAPLLADALPRHPQVHHIRVEDGPGQRLGRSFAVRLWPTLIFLREGQEVARLVRPGSAAEIEAALAAIEGAP